MLISIYNNSNYNNAIICPVSALLKCRIMQSIALNYTFSIRMLTFNVEIQAICYTDLFYTTI